ncbi:MAG TPA: DUF3450 domain-containing protein [Gammaproteobacteria bacterium]|nr:DUF3450 domain-containing protein [Gammaproteobacteria bacterium]
MNKIIAIPILLVLSLSPGVNAADKLDAAVTETVEANQTARESQYRIDSMADDTRDLLQEYRNVLDKLESLRAYNDQLERLSENQDETLASLNRQLDSVEDTQREIVPFMLRMIEVLGEFISLDMPFLAEERQTRLETLRGMMDRPDVSLPDKYRRIMEAYQVEMEYGRTIEATTSAISINGEQNTVDLLRIGRVMLLYQTLDGTRSGYWDKQSTSWKLLPEEYNQSIQKGLHIARKQSPPDLFRIPVFAPAEAGIREPVSQAATFEEPEPEQDQEQVQ